MTRKFKVVYTDPMWAVGPDGIVDPGLAGIERQNYGPDVDLVFGPRKGGTFVKEGPDLQEILHGADAIVIYRTQITPELVSVLKPTCKVVARQGVGYDNLNAPLLAGHGIYGLNVPDYCADEASTHAIAMLLALERQLCVQNDGLKSGEWNIFFGGYPRRLNDLTVGILGFGRIGRAVARKIQPFYGRVVAYDPYVHGDLMKGYGVGKHHDLAGFLSDCDAVMLHALLDAGSHQIINSQSICGMKSGAVLVNAARGNLVEPEAVLAALKAKRIGGYASDVFTPEDPNQHPTNKEILAFDNVVVTSHRAFLSDAAEASQRLRVCEEVTRVLKGGQPPLFGRLA